MNNSFAMQWAIATCAPESVSTIKQSHLGRIDAVQNEDKSDTIYVLSDNHMVVGFGRTYGELTMPNRMSYSAACSKVAGLMGLPSYSV